MRLANWLQIVIVCAVLLMCRYADRLLEDWRIHMSKTPEERLADRQKTIFDNTVMQYWRELAKHYSDWEKNLVERLAKAGVDLKEKTVYMRACDGAIAVVVKKTGHDGLVNITEFSQLPRNAYPVIELIAREGMKSATKGRTGPIAFADSIQAWESMLKTVSTADGSYFSNVR